MNVKTYSKVDLANRLVELRKKASLTRDEVVERASGFSRSSLQDWEQADNTREPKIEYIVELAKIYQVDPSYILFGEQAVIDQIDDVKMIDVYSKPGLIQSRICLAKTWLEDLGVADGDLKGYLCLGNSMAPTLNHNSIAVVDLNQKVIMDGMVYALELNNKIFIRRIHHDTQGYILTGDNKNSQALNIFFEDGNTKMDCGFNIYGRVVCYCDSIQSLCCFQIAGFSGGTLTIYGFKTYEVAPTGEFL